MAANLEKLADDARQLSEYFKKEGYLGVANALDEDVKNFRARANALRLLGLSEYLPSQIAGELQAEVKKRQGKDLVIPQPQNEFTEIYQILTGEGFKVEPMVYFTKEGLSFALLDVSIRPSYSKGQQMFEDDGLSPILERGRKTEEIEVTDETQHIPARSRFGLSWNEIQTYVAPEVLGISHRLPALVESSGAQVRMLTKQEFLEAGKFRYPHFGGSESWEWLNDGSESGERFFAGNSIYGGLSADGKTHPDSHHTDFAFRLQAVFPPQLP